MSVSHSEMKKKAFQSGRKSSLTKIFSSWRFPITSCSIDVYTFRFPLSFPPSWYTYICTFSLSQVFHVLFLLKDKFTFFIINASFCRNKMCIYDVFLQQSGKHCTCDHLLRGIMSDFCRQALQTSVHVSIKTVSLKNCRACEWTTRGRSSASS